ncbi:hypothetical protein U27_04220 [Candidatus Vecturithrix granuli]|uniref:Tetratricopeptide repeat protein n=1 Tax=Vecturithrix granuli TaxID=1499967 RepID=A0A081BY50_VECG1|nr:hypothetical protein U27_04220 [Candidatus Vecturithrix granuli]
MKKRIVNTTPLVCYVWLLITGGCILWYVVRVTLFLAAFASQQGIHSDPYAAIAAFTQALQYDRNHPDYVSGLAGALLESAVRLTSPADSENRAIRLEETETWFQRAIMLNPANPWNYYQLGRLELHRSSKSFQNTIQEDWQDFPTGRYFSLALQNAPNNVFLHYAVGRWLYSHDPEQAFALIRGFLGRGSAQTLNILEGLWPQIQDYAILRRFLPENQDVFLQFSQFLYEKALDYESDLEAICAGVLTQTCPPNVIISRSQDDREIELGNDDGSAEWTTYIAADYVRVQKMICLPQNIDDYQYAALKIFMGGGNKQNFTVVISLNNHEIKRYEQTMPATLTWYEIPFDRRLLDGQSKIYVYMRTLGASTAGNYLRIRGDQETPTVNSVFNFLDTHDLSFDRHEQTGEYMIRLVLRK